MAHKDYIPVELRERVTHQARYRCGYCLRSQELLGMRLTIDHIVPEAVGGPTVEENLWLACSQCNQFKGPQTQAPDPLTNQVWPLFNPRQQVWDEHFSWDAAGVELVGVPLVAAPPSPPCN